jgi:hypothetical protein
MKKTILFLIIFSGFSAEFAFSQADTTEASFAVKDTQNVNVRLFDSDDLFEISLRFDITTYKRKRSDTAYLDAILTYYTGDNDSVNKKVKVRARGDIRRTICDFPPLYLNFKMKESGSDDFIGIDKLKLVPYCKLGYEDYILREFLIYKLYNILTPYSFKVRLLKINFINTAKVSKPIEQFGFAIEPAKLMERRNHMFPVKTVIVTQKSILPEIMDRFAIFNYMIGNTDWAVPNQHNALVYIQPQSENPNLGIVVPYDFDYSGLVNADYAVPADALQNQIKSVRERLFMGICRTEEEYTKSVAEFLEKKDQFFKLINDFPYLSARSKKDMINYLNDFYNMFDKRNSIVREFLYQCKDLGK